MGSVLQYVADAFGDFMDGLLGGIIDWVIDFLTNFVDGIGKVVDAVFSIFDNVPKIMSAFDSLLHTVFWFIPPEVFYVLYVVLALIFIVVLYKWIRGK